jgi:flagellar hook-associated protein 1 FlgK
MSGLFSSLSAATSALTAFRTGLDVTGQNIANINTPGYSRRTLDLAELAPTEARGPGRGVEILAIRAARDYYVHARIGREGAGLAKDSAILDGVGIIDARMGLPGSSIDAEMTAFFDAFSGLASDITSTAARDNVVATGQGLAAAFAALSDGFSEQQRAADVSLRAGVAELNNLAARVATLNDGIVAGGPEVETLRDERDLLITQMAELADVSVIGRSDGAVDVAVAGGRALVVGASSYVIDVQSQPPNGFANLRLHDVDITTAITNGRLGGLIELRDTVVPRYHAGLDQLAYDLAREVNTLHAAGFDGAGAAGGNFFTPLAGVAGAARALTVDAAVAANSQLVAGSGTPNAGDNQNARAIAGLRNATVMTGGTTPIGAWSNLVYEVGSDVSAARAASSTREQVVRQLEQLRDQASGVSLDEEAANLMRYQRSYEASARYFTTIVDTLDTLMAMVR